MTAKVEAVGLEERFELTDHLEVGITLNLQPVDTKTKLKFILSETFTEEQFNKAKDALEDFINAVQGEQE